MIKLCKKTENLKFFIISNLPLGIGVWVSLCNSSSLLPPEGGVTQVFGDNLDLSLGLRGDFGDSLEWSRLVDLLSEWAAFGLELTELLFDFNDALLNDWKRIKS